MSGRSVGLDVGSSGVRAVEIETTRRGRTVTRAARVELPGGAVEGGRVRDEAAVGEAVAELWAGGGFRGRRATLGVGDDRVMVRETGTAEPAPGEAQLLFPTPLEASVLDATTIRGPSGVRTLVVAAAREAVDRLVAAALLGGVEPAGVDAVPLALARASALGGGAEALVDVGAELTIVCLAVDGGVRASRSLPVGGCDLTAGLGQRLAIDDDAAERVKRHQAPGSARQGPAIRAEASWLAGEIASVVEFETAGRPELRPERVVVSGGGGRMGELLEALAARLGGPALPARPFARAQGAANAADQSADDPAVAVAVGLALTPER